jgi:phospholipid/cholesterol/gamma-HCH transport system ATP-binding protein
MAPKFKATKVCESDKTLPRSFKEDLGMASPMIELRNASLSFAKDHILKNINLSVHRGEMFVVVGPSGHGKSVLLKILAGILEPTEGELLIDGQNFFKLNDQQRDRLRRKMGMLFQKNALFDSLTAGENISFPLIETQAANETEVMEKVAHYLDAVGITHAKNLMPDEMSGGMQKRLGIARALALDPDIIFYDDPTAGLDPITSKKIIDIIVQLKKSRGTTSVAITNDMNRAYQMADQMGMILNGELILTGTPQETQKSNDPRVRQFIHGQLAGPLTANA